MAKGFDSKGLSNKASRKGILKAAAEYAQAEKAGELEGLAVKYGATLKSITNAKQHVRISGRDIPAKFLMAMATKLAPAKFSGGKERLGRIFAREGFKLGLLVMAALNPSIGRAAHEDFQKQQSHAIELDGIYFASGSNRPGHIRGFSYVKQALGVAAPHVKANSEDELLALAGMDLPVFVDSGAFSEVEFDENGPKVVKPIDEAQWQEILDLYNRLGLGLGSQLYVVAPDMVGFQKETLERLARWKTELLALRSLGVHIIVVAQGGPAMSQADFDAEAEKVLGFGDYIRGLPCKKNATSTEGIRDFVRARKPAQLHLLGLGIRNKRAPEAARVVAEESPQTALSYDSCLINESMGKTNGRSNHPAETLHGPRVLEQAKNLARALVEQGKTSITCIQELAIRLAWGGGQKSLA